MRSLNPLALLLLIGALAAPAVAQRPTAFRIPIGKAYTGERLIEDAAIVIRLADGALLAVGPAKEVTAGKDGVVDLTAAVPAQMKQQLTAALGRASVTALIVDGNTQRGAEGNLREGALSPGLSAADGLDPLVPGWKQAAEAGVGLSVFAPDAGNALSGVAVLLTPGKRLLDVGLRREVALFGNLTRSSWQNRGRAPATRGDVVRAIVAMCRAARAQGGDSKLEPSPDDPSTWRPDAAVLRRVMRGELPLALRVTSSGDVDAALGLFAELKLQGVLVGGNYALAEPGVIDAIAKAKAGVVLDPLSPAQPARLLAIPGKLAAAEVPFAFSSRAPATLESSLTDQAALAVLHGLDGADAWAALTTGPTRVYRMHASTALRDGAPGIAFHKGDAAGFASPTLGVFRSGKPLGGRQLNQLMQSLLR